MPSQSAIPFSGQLVQAAEGATVPEVRTPLQSALRMTVQLIDLRIRGFQSQLDENLEGHRWSHLAGFAGIVESLQSAKAQVQAVMAGSRPSKAAALRLQLSFEQQRACSDQCREAAVLAKRFDDVSGADGRGTGMLLAARILKTELADRGVR